MCRVSSVESGREFHSSEQQIFRDRPKDEAIKNTGMQIFRFSGSELDRYSLACIKNSAFRDEGSI